MSTVLMPPAVRLDRPRRHVVARAADLLVGRTERTRQAALEATEDALADAAEAGSLDGWATDLDLDGPRADFLALNRAGAFVVTSVWHGVRLTGAAMAGHITDAAKVTDLMRSTVRAHDVTVAVRSIVVVWGSGASDVPHGGVEHGDVLIIRGSELAEFLRWSAAFGTAWSHAQATDCLLDLRHVPAADRVLVSPR